MISVAEAKKIIAQSLVALSPVKLPLLQAAQRTLAQNIFAALDIPPLSNRLWMVMPFGLPIKILY